MIRPPYRPSPESNEHLGRWVLGVLAVALLAGGLYYWRSKQVAPPPEPVAEEPFANAQPLIRHPLETPAGEESEPAPGAAAPTIGERVAGLVGEARYGSLFQTEDLARRLVATVDNLPRQKVAARLLPAKPLPDAFAAVGEEGSEVIGAANFNRYAQWVDLLDSLPAERVAALYKRLYPQLQKEYEALGNPGRYFNDRVIEVIDHLLATPKAPATLPLSRPNVLYEYADPALESLSAGQKLMLRMGPGNAARVRAKLAEVRPLIAARPR